MMLSRFCSSPSGWLLALGLLSGQIQAASQCTGVFTYPVQSHASPGVLTMSGQSSITSSTVGSSYPFITKNVQSQASCNNGGSWSWSASTGTVWNSNCSVTGSVASAISGLSFISDPNDFTANPSDFPSYTSSKDLTCTSSISPDAGTYRYGVWSSQNCAATLQSGKTYYFDTLTISSGATLNLNGATLYVKTLSISGYSNGVTGSSGQLHVNDLTVSGDGKLSANSVTAYNSVTLSSNTASNVSATFQPHYLATATLSAQSIMKLAAGTWPIRQLTAQGNSQVIVQGSGELDLYTLVMSSQGTLTTTSSRSDLLVKLYQTLNVSDNGTINGYLQAHYLNLFQHTSSSNITFYFRGGSHWIKQMTLSGSNTNYVFDSGTAAQLYVNGDVTLTSQMEFNPGGAANNLMLYSFGAVSMASNATLNGIVYVNTGNLTLSGQAVLTGSASAVNITMSDNSKIIHEAYANSWPGVCDETLTCFSDDFSASSLSSTDWVTAVSSGSFTPAIVSGRLQMTQAVTDQATATTLQKLFPGSGNLITVEMDHGAWGGSGADGMAVVLSDASVTPKPGAFGGPLGYGFKTKASGQSTTDISGFAGGWLGVGLDEYGMYSVQGGSSNNSSRVANTLAIRGSGSGTSGYNLLKQTSTLSPTISSSSYPTDTRRYRITVDTRTSGQALVTVERKVGTGSYSTLISSFDALSSSSQATLPSNFYLSLTSSTGSLTNYHAVDNVQICALKTSTSTSVIDHFEYSYSGSPLTCTPQEVTLYACADSSCSTLYTGSVTANLSPSSLTDGGWVSGSSVTFSGGSTTLQLAKRTVGSVTLDVTGSTPSAKPLSTTLCRVGSATATSAACTLTFADSGLLFDVPNKIAGKPATGVTVQAVRKSDNSASCVPGFANVTRNVAFWSSYTSPSDTVNAAAPSVTVNGSNIGKSQAAATSLALAFDSTGTATLSSVNYLDAGQMTLNATYTGSSATSDASLVMSGSDTFVSAPAGICVAPETTCSAGSASCPVFKKAGESFTVTMKPVAWESDSDTDLCSGNTVTPNFALSGIVLGSTLVAPSGGAAATLGVTSYDHSRSASGSASFNQSVSEVGVFKLTATPPSYMGMTIPASSSAPVGRFVPASFVISGGSVTPYCSTSSSAFTYMGQPFATGFVATAVNISGSTTQNYKDAFAKGTANLVAANNLDGVDLSSRLTTVPTLSWSSGVASVNQGSVTANTVFARGSTVESPLTALALGIKIADNESTATTFVKNADLRADQSGDCSTSGNCNAVKLGSGQWFYGRLKAATGQGLASAPLSLAQTLQYYQSGQWVTNSLDSCTALTLTGYDFTGDGQSYSQTNQELAFPNASGGTGHISATLGNGSSSGVTAQASLGQILLQFGAPEQSLKVPYKVVLANQSGSPTWLSDDESLSGMAIFGVTRGNDRIIYRRERY